MTTKFASPLDRLQLPGNKLIAELHGEELARELIRLGVANVSHAKGRSRNLEAYAAHRDKIRQDGADKAWATWLKEHE
jgi:hypothetical protein